MVLSRKLSIAKGFATEDPAPQPAAQRAEQGGQEQHGAAGCKHRAALFHRAGGDGALLRQHAANRLPSGGTVMSYSSGEKLWL